MARTGLEEGASPGAPAQAVSDPAPEARAASFGAQEDRDALSVRLATPAEMERWDELIVGNPDGGHFLQTRAWAEVKAQSGWQPRYLIMARGSARIAILFLRHRFSGLGELWYAPKGPGVSSQDELVELLRRRDAFGSAFLVKVEPEIEARTVNSLWGDGLRKAESDIQINRATIVVDLSVGEDRLLASFHPKTRYNIGLAQRKGVLAEPVPATPNNLELMWELLRETARRAGFPLRPRRYFQTYWAGLAAAGQGQLFFARYGNELLSGVFIAKLGNKAWYKDGGSTRRQKELMAPHLLQWEVMRWLQARGVTRYDLFAVPPPAALSAEHPFYGLHQFKSRFCSRITEYVGTLDLPLSPLRYRLWNLFGERLATLAAATFRHDMLY